MKKISRKTSRKTSRKSTMMRDVAFEKFMKRAKTMKMIKEEAKNNE